MKIDQSKIIYQVKPEEGVVVCVLTGCKHTAINRLLKYAPHLYLARSDTPCFFLKDSFAGVAKCSPEDKFDEEYGKKLALLRAKAKRCKAANAAMKNAIDLLNKEIDNIKAFSIHKVPEDM